MGSQTLERDAVLEFARQYDPQPFHLDEEAGKRSLFGGLSASGWHTASTFIRKVVDARKEHARAIAAAGNPIATWGPSPGFRNLQWPKPVLVGDTVSFRQKVVEKRDLKSRPKTGLVITRSEGRNQKGEIVYKFTGQMLVERRSPYVAPV
ncbi:MAG TPA: MaoC family dehydratase [Hyphomicrobiaceae bacterium]|nr:MaoC family dehydratase [Hyphomicrobiaceae bacterium]